MSSWRTIRPQPSIASRHRHRYTRCHRYSPRTGSATCRANDAGRSSHHHASTAASTQRGEDGGDEQAVTAQPRPQEAGGGQGQGGGPVPDADPHQRHRGAGEHAQGQAGQDQPQRDPDPLLAQQPGVDHRDDRLRAGADPGPLRHRLHAAPPGSDDGDSGWGGEVGEGVPGGGGDRAGVVGEAGVGGRGGDPVEQVRPVGQPGGEDVGVVRVGRRREGMQQPGHHCGDPHGDIVDAIVLTALTDTAMRVPGHAVPPLLAAGRREWVGRAAWVRPLLRRAAGPRRARQGRRGGPAGLRPGRPRRSLRRRHGQPRCRRRRGRWSARRAG